MTLENFIKKFEFLTYTDNGMARTSYLIRIYIPIDSGQTWFDFGCLDSSKLELLHTIFPPDILSREINSISYNQDIPDHIEIVLEEGDDSDTK